MKQSTLVVGLLVAFLGSAPLAHALLVPGKNAAQPASARSIVENIIAQTKVLDFSKNRSRDEQKIEAMIDFQKLYTNAIGDNKAKATVVQQAQIRDLLRKIITKTVYPGAPKFFKNVSIEFTEEETPENALSHITSVVTKGERRSTVEYWLEKNGDQYRVVDLAIENERWVENVRNQFDEIISKHGIPGLISRMEKRLREINSSKSS